MQNVALDKATTNAEATTAPTGDTVPFGQFNISQLEKARHSKTFWAVEPPLPIEEPPRNQQLIRNSRFVPLCFDNGEACFRNSPTSDLVRSISVFTVCGWSWLVKHADRLYALSEKAFGWTGVPSLTVRHTFFAHFCAGEDQEVRCLRYRHAAVPSGQVARLKQAQTCFRASSAALPHALRRRRLSSSVSLALACIWHVPDLLLAERPVPHVYKRRLNP